MKINAGTFFAIGLSSVSLAVALWPRDSTHPIAAVEEYAVPRLALAQNTPPPKLEPTPSQPVMPGSPDIKPAPRPRDRSVTAHIGDEAIEVKIDFDSRSSDVADANEIQWVRDYPRLRDCLEHMSFGGKFVQTDDEMRRVESHLRELLAKNGNRTPKGRIVDVEQQVENNWRIYRECKGATQEQLDATIAGLSTATGYGARGTYAHIIEKDDPAAAREIYEQLLKERGRINMLGTLARNSVPHEIAYLSAMIAVDESNTGRADNNSIDHYREQLSAIEARIDRYEFREALKQAAQILRSPNCCSYP